MKNVENELRKVFFHIHIWKTAGSTFLNICKENFGHSFHRDIMLIQEWFLSLEQINWLLDYHSWIKCYSCHMLSGDLPYNYKNADVLGISFVRDPIKRFMSSYNYMIAENYKGGFSKKISLKEFFEKTFVNNDNPWWRNGQVNIIAGNAPQNQKIPRIIELLNRKKLILLVTERFDESCILLERMFPKEFRDCSYVVSNETKKTKRQDDKNVLKEINRYVHLSTELHVLANTYLDNQLNLYFPDKNEREKYLCDFKNRCTRKIQKQRMIRFFKKCEASFKRKALKFLK